MPHRHQRKADAGRPASYFSEDTIAAPASSFGGAVGIIRVSGPGAFPSLARLASGSSIFERPPRTAVRCYLRSPNGTLLDHAVVLRFVSPESYTGEDCVEYHTHGNPLIARNLVTSLEELGVRRALPGEFSFRAVRNGKLSLSQATGISDLVSAANETAVQLALEKLSGQQNRWIQELGESLRGLALRAESEIDFSEQDFGESLLPDLIKETANIVSKLQRLAGSFKRGSRIQSGVRVAFLGLPNAGKSSLFNALLGEDRSIVSGIPGTTRDVVGEHVTLSAQGASATFRLEDTAGLRASTDEVESLGIQRSLRAGQDADLILFLVDASHPDAISASEKEWVALGLPFEKSLGVLTKTDLAEPAKGSAPETSTIRVKKWVSCSAQTGAGVNELVQEMVQFSSHWYQRDPGEFILTQMEHATAVQNAVQHLERASAAPEVDLFASDIRQALHSLSPLIGETVPDDILNAIFSKFCIGK
ncbi:MAG: tRNA uridine-5-carboxymethylaminomethyl(34) synthesis GTPase MnmE [Bdellovibrionales bacterium GWB1_55_8]|nr:MAG: tRNA uridine-5-carboxymethylaminomethyl(34) synthesis GTPase MnmE [Bdellovibrionales bacterium GWB1_55_8]